MFENLTNRLLQALHNISYSGYISEERIKKTLREIRIALLEADTALPVVCSFIDRVKEKVISCKVNKNFSSGENIIKIVYNELVSVLGEKNYELNLSTQPPAVILVVGLQGVGKTTAVCKIGKFLREKYKKKVLVVSSDIYRPAAIEQLEMLSHHANIDFFPSNINQDPIKIVKSALKEAKLKFYDILLVDTAGRLHIDEKMMCEIKQISDTIDPVETLFVIDAMSGQDAANSARTFGLTLSLTGIVLSKVDSDARGGSALSVRYITKRPIKFISVGENVNALEPFYPKRIASRILDMGDISSLIEDIESTTNYTKIEKLAGKLKEGKNFDLSDFLKQLQLIKDMGGVMNLISKIPGIRQVSHNISNKVQIDDKILTRTEAIINSMTLKERANPEIINGSRKRRIAAGCGMQVQDVNRLLKQFSKVQRATNKVIKNSSKINRNSTF